MPELFGELPQDCNDLKLHAPPVRFQEARSYHKVFAALVKLCDLDIQRIEDVGGDRPSLLDYLDELRGLLEAPLMHEVAGNDSVTLPVRASMGLALYPEDGADGTALMHAADHAMYANKRGRTDSVPSENENAA